MVMGLYANEIRSRCAGYVAERVFHVRFALGALPCDALGAVFFFGRGCCCVHERWTRVGSRFERIPLGLKLRRRADWDDSIAFRGIAERRNWYVGNPATLCSEISRILPVQVACVGIFADAGADGSAGEWRDSAGNSGDGGVGNFSRAGTFAGTLFGAAASFVHGSKMDLRDAASGAVRLFSFFCL